MFADGNIKFIEKAETFSKLEENTVGRGEISPFSTVFSKDFNCRQGLFGKGVIVKANVPLWAQLPSFGGSCPKYNLSSANSFNLDSSKILSSGFGISRCLISLFIPLCARLFGKY